MLHFELIWYVVHTGCLLEQGWEICVVYSVRCLTVRVYSVHCITVRVFKKQQNTLIEMQYNKLQNTLHIRSQLLHVSAPICNQRGVHKKQRFLDPTRNSSAIRPPPPPLA